MTQDETGSNPPEVFMGPTGSETEEFYTYQRKNPGLEKTEYLAWFEEKFKKEIELRRRRSDQPSDLEYMVIKKRSKYRERIGEESTELVQYSDQHPHKTYRELAEWFQGRFGKEIDITAISRAIKRNRADIESGPPHPDVAPAAKRGRRSNANTVVSTNNSNKPSNGPIGSNPTFAVDMSTRPPPAPLGSNGHSPNHTPAGTPNHTPKNGNAILPSQAHHPEPMERKPSVSSNSASSHHPHHQPPPHGYHHHQRGHPSDSPAVPPPAPPTAEQPRTPMWTTVNHPTNGPPPPAPGHTYIQAKREPHPPSSGSPNRPPPSVLPSSQPNRALRSKNPNSPPALAPAPPASQQPHSHQRPTIAAYAPPPPSAATPGAPPPPHSVPAMPPHPFSPRRDPAVHLQQRYTDAVSLSMKSTEEMQRLQGELFQMLHERDSHQRRAQEELHNIQAERDELRHQLGSYKAWVDDLQRGNLELQKREQELKQMRELFEEERERTMQLTNDAAALESRLREREYQLNNARKVLKEHNIDEYGSPTPGAAEGERRSRKDLDAWVNARFTAEKRQEGRLTELVDEVENAGWKEVTTKLQELKHYLHEIQADREDRQAEWPQLVGRVYGSQSPVTQQLSAPLPQPQPQPNEDTRMQDAGEDADDESGGVVVNGDRKASKTSSSDLTPTSRNPSGSPAPPAKSQSAALPQAPIQLQSSPAPSARETRGTAAASKADRMEE